MITTTSLINVIFKLEMTVTRVLLIPAVALMAGCASSHSIQSNISGPGISRVDASVEYVGPGNIKLPREQYPRDVLLVFPVVSGGIFGDPDDDVMFAEKIDESMRFSLELDEKIGEMESRSMPLTDEWKYRGLRITPENTLLARVGTFPYSIKTRQLIGAGGFIDPVSRNTLVLIYVDRACVISGNVILDNARFSHDIILPGKGFHWIQVKRDSHNSYSLERYPDNNANFSIHIQNLIAT
jgi:hypothetical protein